MAGHNEYLAVQRDNELPKNKSNGRENLLHLSKTKQSGRPIFFPISSPGALLMWETCTHSLPLQKNMKTGKGYLPQVLICCH